MTEKEYEAQLSEAQAKRTRDLEKLEANRARREALLTKAITSKKVRVDYQKVGDEAFNPRGKFETDLRRHLRQAQEVAPESEDES